MEQKKWMRLLGARSHVDTKEEGKKYIEKLELNIQGIKPNKKGSHLVQYVKQSYGSFFDLSYKYLSYSQFRLKR